MVIDAHAHCGIIDRSWPQSFEDYARQAAAADIGAVALFSPVPEIYDRHDRRFADTPAWRLRRRESNAYLLSLDPAELTVYPYFFIWNDFAVEQLSAAHCGIKWHRHAGEPIYQYDDPRCRSALDKIRLRRLPVVLEEEFDHTLRFIRDLANGITVIIPHLGMLNGGFRSIIAAGLWELENVWADTALASPGEVREYIRRFGHQRLMFGSDFPFGDPYSELQKIRSLKLDPAAEAEVLGGNFIRLQIGVSTDQRGGCGNQQGQSKGPLAGR
ncbi:amidohydrolase family protein [Desulfosarcina sp.]|uniref:amidohydrolase family protein n=1 Tax=Desulfosarcina sp. TaxID=2027861 RepID=UPI003970D2EB